MNEKRAGALSEKLDFDTIDYLVLHLPDDGLVSDFDAVYIPNFKRQSLINKELGKSKILWRYREGG